MAIQLIVGKRFRSTACSTEVVVLNCPDGVVELTCGGAELLSVEDGGATDAALDPQFAQGSLVGKRYADEAGTIELLCTKSGEGSLALDGVLLGVKAAASLPSSD